MDSTLWGRDVARPLGQRMRPVDMQQIGEELAIKWDDGREDFIGLERFRRACPCAGCKGERDVMGNMYKGPELPLTAKSFELRALNLVGTYAVQPVWGDGHATGLYSFEYLRRIGEREENPKAEGRNPKVDD